MINVKTDRGSCELHMSGDISLLCSDALHILTAIYNSLLENDDKSVADMFAMSMNDAFDEDIIFCTWDVQNERVKAASSRKIDEISELLSGKNVGPVADILVDLLRSLNKKSGD